MARIRIASFMNDSEVKLFFTNSEEAVMKPGVFTYSNLVHAVAGAVGSVVGLTVFFPLDTARTRLQVDEKRKADYSYAVILDIIKQEGFLSLYRGLIPVVTTLCCSNFVYFYTYNCLKAVFLADGVKPDPFKDLGFAFISGVVNVLVTTPLWVVNTRLKLQGIKFQTEEYRGDKQVRYNGIIDCLRKIVKNEGVFALWNGTKPSLILTSNPAIQFMVYETVKRYFQKKLHQNELSGLLYFIIGAISKTVATVVTYPLQILQSRQRAGYNKENQTKSMVQAFQDILG
ncbi:peroxisomal membrane protein PMP34-like [Mercenaria mercenaria]|uniref:peroxisomal membrane protein PMP34-like n=1 Tax=Mercenaria mercenaria TaxID=6596 RepID=UPI00234ED3CD|nr:peroxisomal membrane protein PMP34-like [Mercenaria mercenaria]